MGAARTYQHSPHGMVGRIQHSGVCHVVDCDEPVPVPAWGNPWLVSLAVVLLFAGKRLKRGVAAS
jgi:hypothetical protein